MIRSFLVSFNYGLIGVTSADPTVLFSTFLCGGVYARPVDRDDRLYDGKPDRAILLAH